MRCRILVAIALGGCSFTTTGAGPGDAANGDGAVDDAPSIDAPADASPCRAVEVSAQSSHACARMENGDVWCWGINGKGEVGAPSQAVCSGTACNPMPTKVSVPPVTKLGVAEEHTCAIAGNDVYCWGRDLEGQFGDGQHANAASPRLVTQRAGATWIGGGLRYACSLHAGVVKCAGDNANGEVGDPTTAAHDTPFTTVPSGSDVLATGYSHACTLSGGFVYCWGANDAGQVDTNISANVFAPKIVMGIATVTAIANGYQHTCAVLAAGDVRCWGANGYGQLGGGDILPHLGSIVTSQVVGVVDIAAGSDHTCARTPAGTVYCWGERYGATPVQVPLPRPAVSIAAGSYHDCFVLDDGTLQCLGSNNYGQLGTGVTSNGVSTIATQVALCP